MKLEHSLVRLGGRYERALQARDYKTAADIECQLGAIYDDPTVEFNPGQWFIHGRNLIRTWRKMDEVHPW